MIELERAINEIVMETSNTTIVNSVYYKMRMDIIHGQIMKANYFQWRREIKYKKDQLAFDQFKKKIVYEMTEEEKLEEQLEQLHEAKRS